MSFIELNNLSDPIVNRNSLSMKSGKLTVIKGTTGTGKTYLIRDVLYGNLSSLYSDTVLNSSTENGLVKGDTGVPVFPVAVTKGALGDVSCITMALISVLLSYGDMVCSRCGDSMESLKAGDIAEDIKKRFSEKFLRLVVPFGFSNHKELKDKTAIFRQRGLLKFILNGQILELESSGKNCASEGEGFVIIDSVEVFEEEYEILEEGVLTALELSGGPLAAVNDDNIRYYSVRPVCPSCGNKSAGNDPEDYYSMYKEGKRWFLKEFSFNGIRGDRLTELTVSELKGVLAEVENDAITERIVQRLNLLEEAGFGVKPLVIETSEMSEEDRKLISVSLWGSNSIDKAVFLFDDFSMGISEKSSDFLKSTIELILKRDNTVIVSDNSGTFDNIADTVIQLESRDSEPEMREQLNSVTPGLIRDLNHIDLVEGGAVTVLDPSGLISFEKTADFVKKEYGKRFKYIVRPELKRIRGSALSTVATSSGVLTEIAEIYANLPEAAKRGFKKRDFMYTADEGACELCSGRGYISVDNRNLICDECHGLRYSKTTDSIEYKGYAVSRILEKSVREVYDLLKDYPSLKRILGGILKAGLGYLKLNLESSKMSGGESVLLNLALECSKDSTERIIILDNPYDGFHHGDFVRTDRLIKSFLDRNGCVLVYNCRSDIAYPGPDLFLMVKD